MKKLEGINPLESIIYIPIPDDFNEKIGDFEINTNIMLPVEPPENKEDWSLDDLSWEMIISAMLKIFAYQPEHEDREYFRDFVLAVKPNIIADLTNSAAIKAQDKNFDLAEEIFLAVIGLDPLNPLLRINLALLYEQKWENSKILEDKKLENELLIITETAFKEIASLENSPEIIWYYMGFFYYKQGKYDVSLQHFSDYAKTGKDPDRVEESERMAKEIEIMKLNNSLFQEAYNLVHNGNEKEGIEKVKIFLKENSDVWNAWFLLGWGERRLGNFIDAKSAFVKALELGKPNSELYNELAICSMEMFNFKESKDYLDKALALDPENMKIVSNMGILSAKTGNMEEAETFFKIALEIEPNDPVAKQYLQMIENNK